VLARGSDPPDPPLAGGLCDSVARPWALVAEENTPLDREFHDAAHAHQGVSEYETVALSG